MRLALGVEYDGGRFCGWQSQSGGCGVQDALESALGAVAAARVRVIAAGRTDAGVHATLQVVHFDTEARRPHTAWVRGANARLPRVVAVRWAVPVPDAFHARFSAIARSYTYALVDGPTRPGLLDGRVGWHHRPLALEPMREAAAKLVGRHDFSAFRAAECQARSPVRTVHRATVERAGDRLLFRFTADAFLHHMVRNAVGSLVYIGSGRHRPDWIDELLAARDRDRAAPTFGPEGLYLTGVEYGPASPLPESNREVWIP